MAGVPTQPTPSATPSKTPSMSVTPSNTPSISITPTVTPSISITSTPSSTPGTSPSVTPTVTVTPTITPTITPSKTPSLTPSLTPSISVTPSITPTPSPSPDCTNLNIFGQMQAAALQFMRTAFGYYKINLNQTKKNIYGEALEKWYYDPFLIKGTIDRDNDTIRDEMFGPDIEKTIKITMPKVAWEEGITGQIVGLNTSPEIGDIILDRTTERYYEIHNVVYGYIPIVSNIGVGSDNCPQAELVTFSLECHHTRVSRLNISPYKLL